MRRFWHGKADIMNYTVHRHLIIANRSYTSKKGIESPFLMYNLM